ncbi:signal recognition particle receptor FtsY [Gottschalkia purinilytica]|uniref:Signal recognition particle receptor FtsY n=1 Tax=Gottschalkia purinilytica TaxID=1503 RepID=A0A0L0WBB6_GOTPU|nr:signal recognition particle-docking protein FtsY [Gottschalkia purinilytica]KNF08781.1 signal recognition particle receptor FtsY [Gottschalkia purinilytica]
MFKKIFGWGKKKKEEELQQIDIDKEEIESSEIEADIETNEDIEEKLDNTVKEEVTQENDLEETIKENNDETKLYEKIVEEEIKEESVKEETSIDTDKIEEINEQTEEEAKEKIETEKKGFFSRLKSGLEKTRKGITEKVDGILGSYKKIDEELFEDLEEALITADIGVNTTLDIIEKVKQKIKERKITEVNDIKDILKEEIREVLTQGDSNSKLNIEPSPAIILVVGVNGAGKTTTIGKLSSRLKQEGKKVMIAAGDTFRAAAIEQLDEWANRSGVEIISHQEGADPAAVIYDGIQSAKARKVDVLICDTAGRLHNKKNLMNELNKIFRVVEREYPEAKREVLLVVDATTGQNAVLQAKTFKEACDITGIVLTKLDGTAKGGVVVAVQSELNVPVKLVGVGESINDLQDFNAENFVNAIFDSE